ncbi:MAG: protein-methionine-sulfoxide reductase catalytic subunit MsrP [Planctomycetota bacterium]
MSDSITTKKLYLNRRKWIKAATLATSVPASAAAYRIMQPIDVGVPLQPKLGNWSKSSTFQSSPLGDLLGGDWKTPLYDLTHLNNFHEFTTDQRAVAEKARDFVTDRWTVEVGGIVERPIRLTIDEIREQFPIEERTYRMRCVEGWSMVIPWAGFPLAALLERVRPTSKANYVAFQTLHDPKQMPNQIPGELSWPYDEGLRLDEAFHPLTIMATGLYGRRLPPQNGAPIRLVVPWKYGFKSIKSVVKINLVEDQPETAWNRAAAHENGFYANVNPEVDHPRWSQATERRVGEFFRRNTLPFNGYEKQVEHLYRGMDLNVHF